MKSFKEFNETNSPTTLDESRLIRKGLGIVYGRNSRNFGNQSVQNFKSAQQDLSRTNNNDNLDKRIQGLEQGLIKISEGMINMRYQIGSLVSMVNVLILINERTDDQFRKLMVRRR